MPKILPRKLLSFATYFDSKSKKEPPKPEKMDTTPSSDLEIKNKKKLPQTITKTNTDEMSLDETILADFEYKGYYKFGRILGRGSFGTVIECIRKQDETPVVLKFFKSSSIHKWIPESMIANDLDPNLKKSSEFFGVKREEYDDIDRSLPSEVACLVRSYNCEGVVKIVDYLPPTNDEALSSIVGIVFEHNPDEISLFEYLLQKRSLKEPEAKILMRQIISISINLLQSFSILHGDLKSENILINQVTKRITLIDFGAAQMIDFPSSQNNSMTRSESVCGKMQALNCTSQSRQMFKPVRTFRGTNLYKPPEYILHHCFYPRPSTVWTFGIILFDMVCGRFPFDSDSDVLVHQEKEIFHDHQDIKSNLSSDFCDLIKRCLAFYVADRIVIEKIFDHPWIRND